MICFESKSSPYSYHTLMIKAHFISLFEMLLLGLFINGCSNIDKIIKWTTAVITFRDLILSTLSATVLFHFSTQWQRLQYGREFVVSSRLDPRMIWEKRQDLPSSWLCGLQELKAILVQVFTRRQTDVSTNDMNLHKFRILTHVAALSSF